MIRAVLLSFLLSLMVTAPSITQEPSYNGRTLSEWQAMLKEDPVPRKRRAALVALGQLGQSHAEHLPAIVLLAGKTLRNDSAAVVREQAATLLGQQKVDEVVLATLPDLVESVRIERELPVKKQVTQILGRFGKSAGTAVPALLSNLTMEQDAGLRAATAEALGRIGPEAKSAASALLPLLQEKDIPLRRAAIFALGRIEPDDAKAVSEALVKRVTDDPEAPLRLEAVQSLGFLGEKTELVVRAVASRLTEPEAEFRVVASLTLAKFGSSLAVVRPELQKAFTSDADKQVRLNLVRVLTQASGEDRSTVIPLLAERLTADQDFEVRLAIAEELGTYGAAAKAALPALRIAQRDSQVKVREAATRAIKLIEKK